MINPIQLIESNARRLHDAGLISPKVEYDRVLMDVYLTFLKSGLIYPRPLNYSELLEQTPSKYFACPIHMVDTFSVSTLTIQNRVKHCIDLLEFDISDSDRRAVSELYDCLPLTADQANTFLINKGVIETSYSHDGLAFLLKLVTGHSVKNVPISIYDDTNESNSTEKVRAKRNSKPSVFLLCPDGLSPQKLKTHFLKVLRSVRAMSNQLGFVVLDLICNTVPFVYKKKNILDSDLLKSILSTRTEYEYISSGIVIASSVDESEFIRLLSLLVNKLESVPVPVVRIFFDLFFDYKLQVSRAKGTGDKSRADRKKIAFVDFIHGYSSSDVSDDVLFSVVELSKILVVTGDGKSDFLRIRPESLNSDYLNNQSYWLELFLDFVKETPSQKLTLDDFFDFYKDRVSISFSSAISNPFGFFGKNDVGFFVTDDHVTYSNNRRGEFIQPDFDIVTDEIAFKLSQLEELKHLGLSNYSVYEEAFNSAWKAKKGAGKKRKDLIDLYADASFVNDLREWMVNSRPQSSVSHIKADIAVCNTSLTSLHKRLAYMRAQYELSNSSTSRKSGVNHEALEASISSILHRIDMWEHRISVNESLLSDIAQSDLSIQMAKIESDLQVLYAKRKGLRIKTKEYDAHLKIHDWIVQAGGVIESDVIRKTIDSHLHSLCSKSVPENVHIYHTLYNLFNYHPFGAYLKFRMHTDI